MKNLYNYGLTFLGFIVISYYIWFRFIQERLPRDIPFSLSLFSLVTLSFIIIVFFMALKQVIKPKITDVHPFLIKCYKPFSVFNEKVKNIRYINSFIFSIAKTLTFINYQQIHDNFRLYLILFFLPKYILIFLLYIDILYFKKLFLVYIFAFISLIPLILKYFLFLMESTLEKYIKDLELLYEIEILSTDPDPELDYAKLIKGDGNFGFTIRSYLNQQNFSKNNCKYKCIVTWEALEKYYPKRELYLSNLTQEQKLVIEKEFYDLMPSIINMHNIIYIFNKNKIPRLFNSEMTKITIFHICLNIIAWSYILIISIQTFTFTDMESHFLKAFQETYEPFSDTFLC